MRFATGTNDGYYYVDSIEGTWNSGRDEGPNLGYKPRYKEGYFPVPPTDTQQDIRTEMVPADGGARHRRSRRSTTRWRPPARPRSTCASTRSSTMADQLMVYKYIVQERRARTHGKTATFMPKPLFGDNGSGMHTHQSLWKDGKPLFAGNEYAGLSKMALYYIGGILKHAQALAAFTNPTTNSYKRLVPGYEAPVNLAYSSAQPLGVDPHPDVLGIAEGEAHRGALPGPDLQSVPRLRGDADGRPRRDREQDRSGRAARQEHLRALAGGAREGADHAAAASNEALDNLEKDHEFLLKGDVFTQDVIETWIEYKREAEIDADARCARTPHEFELYFDM